MSFISSELREKNAYSESDRKNDARSKTDTRAITSGKFAELSSIKVIVSCKKLSELSGSKCRDFVIKLNQTNIKMVNHRSCCLSVCFLQILHYLFGFGQNSFPCSYQAT